MPQNVADPVRDAIRKSLLTTTAVGAGSLAAGTLLGGMKDMGKGIANSHRESVSKAYSPNLVTPYRTMKRYKKKQDAAVLKEKAIQSKKKKQDAKALKSKAKQNATESKNTALKTRPLSLTVKVSENKKAFIAKLLQAWRDKSNALRGKYPGIDAFVDKTRNAMDSVTANVVKPITDKALPDGWLHGLQDDAKKLKERFRNRYLNKQGGALEASGQRVLHDLGNVFSAVESAVQKGADSAVASNTTKSILPEFAGGAVTQPGQTAPFVYPASAAAAVLGTSAGLLAGRKASKWLRKSQAKRERDRMERLYREALLEERNSKVGQALDELYDKVEALPQVVQKTKEASYLGTALTAQLTLMSILGALGLASGYSAADKESTRQNDIDKQKKLERITEPKGYIATPVPVDYVRGQFK